MTGKDRGAALTCTEAEGAGGEPGTGKGDAEKRKEVLRNEMS